MKTRAAVAFEAGKPLEIVEVDLEGPRQGEVLVEVKATGVCHTDAFTCPAMTPRALSPPFSVTRVPVSWWRLGLVSPASNRATM